MTVAAPESTSPAPRSTDRDVVALEHVSKVYSNGTAALDNLSLSVARGAFVSLLGPSGCGKSTALRIIAGLAAPSTGSVAWPASPLDRHGMPQGDVGFVFQDPTLMPWASVFDNVYLPLRLQRVSRAEAQPRIAAMLAAVGLTAFARAYPRELSGGMKMRVSIARALITNPRLLLLDEPFAALDEITRQRLNDDVLRLWEQSGVTVVFVTHSVFESAYLSNRIIVMTPRPGRVFADIPITHAAPRNAAYRTSEAYRATTELVSDALQRAIGPGGIDGQR